MAIDEHEHEPRPYKRVKLRKGTFSCKECKRRRKRCIISPSSTSGICQSCQRLGCRCIGQDYCDADIGNVAEASQRLEHIEELAASLVKQKQQRQLALQRSRQVCSTHLINPLTGAGEDRMSRCRSLSGYFYSVLPHPFIGSLMAKHGKAAYYGLREPLKLSKTSNTAPDELLVPATVQPACLARKLIRFAVSLIYVNEASPEHLDDLQLTASATETAQRYVEAARHLTSKYELLQSTTGLECIMMEGHYSVHLGRLREAGASFRKALTLAQRIELPATASTDSDEDNVARIACFRLMSANRGLSLYAGEACDLLDDSFTQKRGAEIVQPGEQLDRLNVRIWRRLIARNIRVQRCANREVVLQAELAETLSIDSEMKRAMLSIPSTWWELPTVPATNADPQAESSFSRLNTSKDHYHTIVLTHLPYVLQASTNPFGDAFTYSRAAAIAASREVLLRFPIFQQFKHVPASFRAIEHKAFIAGMVLLLAHMRSHQSQEFDAIGHDRPKDLNAVLANIDSMEHLFARDRNNPGSECAYTLRRLMEVEQGMACGTAYSVFCSHNAISGPESLGQAFALNIQLPYFGTLHIDRLDITNGANLSWTSLHTPDSLMEYMGLPNGDYGTFAMEHEAEKDEVSRDTYHSF